MRKAYLRNNLSQKLFKLGSLNLLYITTTVWFVEPVTLLLGRIYKVQKELLLLPRCRRQRPRQRQHPPPPPRPDFFVKIF